MQKEWHFRLPLGFRQEETIEYTSVWQAQQILLTKRANRYVRALREGEGAALYAARIVCPYCGRSFVGNGYSLRRKSFVTCVAPLRPRPPKARVLAWASPQLSLFDEENTLLSLAPAAQPVEEFLCPACGEISYPDAGEREVHLRLHRGKITLRSAVLRLSEMACLHRADGDRVHLDFPLYETVVFNLRRGRVILRYEGKDRTLLYCRDITADPRQMCRGANDEVLAHYPQVMRCLRRLFAQAWGRPLPFEKHSIDRWTLTQMTQFVGYGRDFYACIPYVADSFCVAPSFRAVARRMHDVRRLPSLYDGSALPQVKSLRRCLFERPGLFFYLREIEEMWTVLGDVNLLCRFLTGARGFQVLSALYTRPGMLCYLQDYAAVKSPHRLLACVEKTWDMVASRAMDYAAMGPAARRQMQKSWCSRTPAPHHRALSHSVPMRLPAAAIPDEVVNGYFFFWLRSSNDYALAAHRLQNCLGEWQMQHAPVVCVRKGERYVAALEVDHPHVVQAYAYRNRPIACDPPLAEAVDTWMLRHGLQRTVHQNDEEEEPL